MTTIKTYSANINPVVITKHQKHQLVSWNENELLKLSPASATGTMLDILWLNAHMSNPSLLFYARSGLCTAKMGTLRGTIAIKGKEHRMISLLETILIDLAFSLATDPYTQPIEQESVASMQKTLQTLAHTTAPTHEDWESLALTNSREQLKALSTYFNSADDIIQSRGIFAFLCGMLQMHFEENLHRHICESEECIRKCENHLRDKEKTGWIEPKEPTGTAI